MHPPLRITRLAARRFARRALGLDTPFPDVGSALAHHGYIQIDPINVCGRMHDLILRNRVENYRQGDLMRHLHGDGSTIPAEFRTGFEHHLPDSGVLVAFPLDAWPHLLSAMHHRTERDSAWSGKLTAEEIELSNHILAEIAIRGPLSSTDIDDKRRNVSAIWGSATLAKSVLQKLFFHGRVLIARRDGNRRLYDLPERVLPAATLVAKEPDATDTARWLALTKLRQRRLAILKREELKHVADDVQAIKLTDADSPTFHCLREDLALLDAAGAPSPAMLLAPLDPLIYDRKLTSALWSFDYTWEVYTPPGKRVRGYYALPILSGDELVGHVDPKANFKTRKLEIISRSVRRGHPVAGSVKSLAKFLGLR
ncbi:YcaQ family DNA glycosylase [Luteolibacter yonseiensis]|uniref:YcaQ family DNA glycosylase n=1 Tax=Luteolibacter yonseiensis TaxID=1144680 RepID=A0A934VBI9_9BACT|nr:crosslink repair DNA glycosylase YcaQ family protein [Luteolibacter yonseiensis]MBK1815469.1 YcaQ family DNA glycosylase [Luteolibacter yonseiensis]